MLLTGDGVVLLVSAKGAVVSLVSKKPGASVSIGNSISSAIMGSSSSISPQVEYGGNVLLFNLQLISPCNSVTVAGLPMPRAASSISVAFNTTVLGSTSAVDVLE